MDRKPPLRARRSRPSLLAVFGLGAFAGIPIGMVWSWLDYGAFELGYMSNHVVGGALITGVLAVTVAAVWRRLSGRARE